MGVTQQRRITVMATSRVSAPSHILENIHSTRLVNNKKFGISLWAPQANGSLTSAHHWFRATVRSAGVKLHFQNVTPCRSSWRPHVSLRYFCIIQIGPASMHIDTQVLVHGDNFRSSLLPLPILHRGIYPSFPSMHGGSHLLQRAGKEILRIP